MSYTEPCWAWPVDFVGTDYFDDDDTLEQAILTAAVRRCLLDLEFAFPERRLLNLTNELRHAVETVQADLVAEARAQGISWARIGDALRVGRTAAQKRYGRGLSQERKEQLEREARAAMEWAHDVDEDQADEEPAAQRFLTQITERRRKQ